MSTGVYSLAKKAMEDNNKRTLLVLGASSDQVFLIRTAQKMGLRVLVIDMNPDSKGFQIADDHAVISTRDIPSICGFLDGYRRNGHRVAGVLTMGSDIPDIVAAVSQHLGAPGIPLESARIAVNKYAMKQRFREKGIPIPWFQEIHSPADLKHVVLKHGFPLVLKPVDRSGSRGVFKLDEGCNLEDLYIKTRDFSFSGQVMVEKFLEGLQISTETVMFNGQGITPGFADRNYDLLARFLPQIMENGGWMPSILSDTERKQVEELVVRTSLALDITDGVTKGDVVMTPEGPKIIEMAARLSGGDFCESLVPLSIGVNYVESAIKIAIGEQVDFKNLEPRFNRAVVNRYFFPSPGRLIRIEGAEEVQKNDWIKKLEFWYKPGDLVPPPLSHAHRFGVFIAVGQTRSEVDKKAEWVYRTIKIITEPV
jgi:biotin carboxylase